MKKIIIALLLVLLTVGLCVSCNGDVDSQIFNANGDCIWISDEDGGPVVVCFNGSYYPVAEFGPVDSFYVAYIFPGTEGEQSGNIIRFEDESTLNLTTNIFDDGETYELTKYTGKYTAGEVPISVDSGDKAIGTLTTKLGIICILESEDE